jgi:hypothetical protein
MVLMVGKLSYSRGSQPFGTWVPPIKILPLCVPLNQSCIPFAYPQIKNSSHAYPLYASFEWFLKFGIPPANGMRTPRGTPTPG